MSETSVRHLKLVYDPDRPRTDPGPTPDSPRIDPGATPDGARTDRVWAPDRPRLDPGPTPDRPCAGPKHLFVLTCREEHYQLMTHSHAQTHH